MLVKHAPGALRSPSPYGCSFWLDMQEALKQCSAVVVEVEGCCRTTMSSLRYFNNEIVVTTLTASEGVVYFYGMIWVAFQEEA